MAHVGGRVAWERTKITTKKELQKNTHKKGVDIHILKLYYFLLANTLMLRAARYSPQDR